MIKIIEHGYKTYEIYCDNCNCHFKYDISDTINGHVYCPDCGSVLVHFISNNTGETCGDEE